MSVLDCVVYTHLKGVRKEGQIIGDICNVTSDHHHNIVLTGSILV